MAPSNQLKRLIKTMSKEAPPGLVAAKPAFYYTQPQGLYD